MSCLKTHKSHIIFSLFVPVKFHRSYTLVKRIVQDYFYYITIHFHVDKVCPFEETRTLARTPRPLPSRTLRASESGKILIFHNCIFLKLHLNFSFFPLTYFPEVVQPLTVSTYPIEIKIKLSSARECMNVVTGGHKQEQEVIM